MKATIKKQIERGIREIVAIGDKIPVVSRTTKETQGFLTVTAVSREEIHGTIQREGILFAGTPAKFRVPQLTQKGGEYALNLQPATV